MRAAGSSSPVAGLMVLVAAACHGPHYRAHDALGGELAAPVFVDDEELLDVFAVRVVHQAPASGDDTDSWLLEFTNQDLEAMALAVDCTWADTNGVVVAGADRRWLHLAPQQSVRIGFVAPATASLAGVVVGWDR